MKVQFIIDSLGRGGTQTALVLLSRELVARGFSVRVIGLSDDADELVVSRLETAGASVRVIGRSRLAAGVGLWDVFRDIRCYAPDVVQTMLPYADYIGRVLGRLARVPALVSSIRARNVHKAAWQFWLDRLTVGLADRVVFNSAEVVAFSMAREGVAREQAVVVENGVEITDAVDDSSALRAELGIPAGVPVVVSVGRVVEQKDHASLVRALTLGGEMVGKAHVVVAGDGPLLPEVQSLAEGLGVAGRVHLVGLRDDVRELLGLCDVYAHPATFEGMPNAVMEAMACGCAVVACDIDGNRELIADGENGVLVPASNTKALATALEGLLTDNQLANRLGSNAREFIREQYSVNRMADAYTALYSSLVR